MINKPRRPGRQVIAVRDVLADMRHRLDVKGKCNKLSPSPFTAQEPLDGRTGQVTRQQGSRTDAAAKFHMSGNDGPSGDGEGVSRVVHIVGLGPQRLPHSAWQRAFPRNPSCSQAR